MSDMTAETEKVGIEGSGADSIAEIELPEAITVGDLAALMEIGAVEVIKELMRGGYMLTINDVVEYDVASIVAQVFGYQATMNVGSDKPATSVKLEAADEDPDNLTERPPVVTILGHVDHGKTTLLDSIQKTNIVSGEAGGITQHIGAYQVESNGKFITFLDTPGHEAFTAMRARGAQVTDIAILVVAADDGIMPQTVEAINHAKAANVPIVVAINKIDLPSSDLDRVKRQLSENDLLIEEWGGDIISVSVSALKGDGVPELLENIQVVAEVSELKANPNRDAKGVVVESRVDKSKGPVATLLVQTGTLSVGDNVVVGTVRGRIKAMLTENGERVMSASPSRAIEILGLTGVPDAGDVFEVVSSEKAARKIVDERERQKEREKSLNPSLEDVRSRIETGEVSSLNLIIKTDVQGAIDAVRGSLEHLEDHEINLSLIHISTGTLTESDVMLALASKAVLVGFNTSIEPGASSLASQNGIEVRFYDVIYHLTEDIQKALDGLLEPEYDDVLEGRATVRAVFNISKRGKIAGIYVNDGQIIRDSTISVIREGTALYSGRIASLKHFKDDVRELNSGFEGGLRLEGFENFEEGDVLEAHRTQRTR
tara:strand:+ start:12255 stop:14057 length:1803 start_codon:yes stop_codon:yes gene_type:complete